MIRGMIGGVVWGGVVSAGLGLVLTQFGGRVDVVRAAVPPVALDASQAVAPAAGGTVVPAGTALGAAPDVTSAPQPGAGPGSDTPIGGGGDVARPATAAIDTQVAIVAPDSAAQIAPSANAPISAPRSPQAQLPRAGADGLPTRVPDTPIATAPGVTAAVPDTPVLDVGQGGLAPRPSIVAPDVTSAPAAETPNLPGFDPGTSNDSPVTGANPPARPGAMGVPGGPAARADPTEGAPVQPSRPALVRPILTRPAAPAPSPADGPGDDILAVLVPDTALPRPADTGELDRDEADQEPDIEGAPAPARGAAGGVIVNRLPRIGDPLPGEVDDAAADAAADQPDALVEPVAPTDPDAEAEVEAGPVGIGALYDFAEPFTREPDAPLIAVVLIDDPTSNTNFAALPLAISIAVPSDAIGSVQRAQAHRDAGREVVLIPPVVASDSRVQIAQRMRDALAFVPQAVAVMDMPDQRFQRSQFAVGEVMVTIAQTGHGLIVYPGGLNTAERLAVQQDVPSSRVFKDIDGQGQNVAGVKLLLDQAAFQARQRDEVILIGRNRPETVQALAEWVDQRLDDSVVLAPVSAALRP